MKNIKLSATNLRAILIFAIAFGTVGAILSFNAFQQSLQKSLQKDQDDANNSSAITSATPQQIQILKTKLANLKSTRDKLTTITTSSQNYKDQATKDINKYASLSGVSINGDIIFNRPVTFGVSSQLQFGNISSLPAVVTLNNPVPLTSYLKFIKLIENNSPLMQLAGVNIKLAPDSNNNIISDPLTIEVLAR